ncbi:5-formyltetrahydrofolate cyclo-ligase [Paractinoplanes hotanensis]|uniref:5-formyltetrahydrofolate cyclo-ligase n=1 Tax=Paractinoplanes hotanensis TaxID=2906497 RepID=A0ABT0XU04_9ACTN|nr:5-formyltetrahydrofolate cyclo-ligase [Actinoplanes hotanensis]MCM4077130.1 5-formyltetrahydrofolate cyclo-ligase [Actinoplanes hotanensis]
MSDLTRDAEGSRSAKIALRNRLLTSRRSLTSNELAAAAAQVQRQTLSLVRHEGAAVVAAYMPIGSEPGGPGLVEALAAQVRVLLPVLLPDGDLDWAAFSTLTAGPRGLLEPVGPRLGVAAITTADLVLVPGLAVDRAGLRMGRGGGSYDRALSRLPASGGPLVVALLHDGELVESVPTEPHDRPVQAVITPAGGLTVLANRSV